MLSCYLNIKFSQNASDAKDRYHHIFKVKDADVETIALDKEERRRSTYNKFAYGEIERIVTSFMVE